MLKIWYYGGTEYMNDAPSYFDNVYEDEWIEDEFVKEMILDVDHSVVVGLTTDAMREAIAGGAKTIIACRVGNGGTQGTITLKDVNDSDTLCITAKYPGEKNFMVTVREKLSDSSLKECIFYAGTTEFEKVEFASGEGEAKALADALATSKNFKAELKENKESVILETISQGVFTSGTNPETTTGDYANAFAQIEPYEFNTVCLDTEDTEIHLLLQSFVNRIFDAGSLAQAVVAEKHTVDLETRMKHERHLMMKR